MKRADLHAEIKELRRQRLVLIRRCMDLRRLEADPHRDDPAADTSAAAEEERAWIAKAVLRPGERL